MEIRNSNFFVPKCLEKELKILEDSNFNYTNIYNALFNFSKNNNKIELYRKLIVANSKNLYNTYNTNNNAKPTSNEDFFSIIIPNYSKEFVLKLLKNFHIQINQTLKGLREKQENKDNSDQVECCHQKKLKEKKYIDNINNDKKDKINNNEGTTNKKTNSLIGKLYSKTLSKIFGSAEASEENNNRGNSVFNNITKINNIDLNCDYFNVELKSNDNLTALGKLKSNFVSQFSKYELFRYFYENNPIPLINNKSKNVDLNYNYNRNNNNNNLINDTVSQNLIISQNNDVTTDDCYNNIFIAKQIQANNFYQSKNAINGLSTSVEKKHPDFALLFFKFIISKENKRNYFNLKMPFSNKQTNYQVEPEEEFALIVSLIDCIKPLINQSSFNNNNNSNPNASENKFIINNYKNDKTNNINLNENSENNDFNVYTKVNFCIFTKNQIEQIERNTHNNNNIQKTSKLLEHFNNENSKIKLFCELIENFKALILSKIKVNCEKNIQATKDEEDFILQSLISFEHQQIKKIDIKSNMAAEDYYFSKKNSSTIKKEDEINLDLIDINFCKINEGYNSNRSDGSETSLIDLEQLNSSWITNYNSELNNDFKFEHDPEYKSLKKMQAFDLKKHNYYETYIKMLSELKSILQADPIEIFTENELIRHIYGWRGDLDGCRESLLALKAWRSQAKPELYSYSADFAIFPEIPFKPLLHISCRDVYGRPVLKLSPEFLNPKLLSVELLCKFLVFTLEGACAQMESYFDKFILFVDLKNVGYSNISTEHLKKVNEFTTKYYVERLENIYIINKGFLFGMIWAIMSKFMDERIHKKLVVVDKSHKASLQYLLGDNFEQIGINF